MKVGDLVRDIEWGEIGLVISITNTRRRPYKILCTNGIIQWLPRRYIEKEYEVVSESR